MDLVICLQHNYSATCACTRFSIGWAYTAPHKEEENFVSLKENLNQTKIERRKYCGALSLCLSLSRTMSEKTNHSDILRALWEGKHLIGSITRFYCSLDLS
jgi:hypothetical protein